MTTVMETFSRFDVRGVVKKWNGKENGSSEFGRAVGVGRCELKGKGGVQVVR